MGASVLLAALLAWQAAAPAGTPVRNVVWQQLYRQRSAAEMAKEFETPSRPLFRYRAAIVGMMPLEPGMSVAEIGAGSGFIARVMAEKVGPTGRVFANELEPSMVAYMADRAKTEGLANFTSVQGKETSTGLDSGAMDAIAIADAFSYFDRPGEMLRSIAEALKPGGVLVIVDLPREGDGATATGVDADDVVSAVARAGLERIDEISVVPGHYALRFRKP